MEKAVILPQLLAAPASSTSLAKTAAVRGEKNIAKAIVPEDNALTVTGLSFSTDRAS